MKVVKKEKQVKEIEVTLESYILCDKCNKKIETNVYDAFKCEFIHQTGDSYPEGGDGEKQEMELCQRCAEKLVILLRENGYRVTDSEWFW